MIEYEQPIRLYRVESFEALHEIYSQDEYSHGRAMDAPSYLPAGSGIRFDGPRWCLLATRICARSHQ